MTTPMSASRQAQPGPAFVGRKHEMAQLRAGLGRALDHRGGMFLLSGEPGIGKTRLAEQIAHEAAERGMAVYWGLSTQAEGAPAYWPWVQILRGLLADLGPDEFGRLAGQRMSQILRMVPELRDPFPDVAPASMDDDAARFGMYDAVVQLLVHAAASRPSLLLLEDLHWADEPSLILLQQIAPTLLHSALLIVGTYRHRELAAEHRLRAQFADYVRRGDTTEISVSGLADADVASLLRVLTDFEPADELVRRLQAQTEGNPFFLKELAQSLIADDDQPAGATVLPEGVAAVLRQRIEGLSPDCRWVLEVGAVMGQVLDLAAIEAITSIPRPRLLDLLDEAIARGVIAARGKRYAFTHGLFRDTVYAGLSTTRRSDLHRAVANVLEEFDTDGDRVPAGRLAYHYLQAASTDQTLQAKARTYAIAAANQAMAELAYEEAVPLLESAIGVDGAGDPRARANLLIDLGRARFMAGDVIAAIAAAQDAARIAEEVRDNDLLARAALVVRGVGGMGASPQIKDLGELALAHPPKALALRIQLLSQMAVALIWLPSAEVESRALEMSSEAIRLAEDAVDPDVVFAAIHARQMAVSGPDGVEERLQLAQRALELSRRSGRKWFEQWAHSWAADALSQLGRMKEAEAELAHLRRLADELREPRLLWRTLLAEAWLAVLQGRFADARRLSDAALDIGRKGQRPMAEWNHAIHSVVLSIFVGGEPAVWSANAEGSPGWDVASKLNRAIVLIRTGRFEEARLTLRSLVDVLPAGILPRFEWLFIMSGIVRAVVTVGDSALAAVLYEALAPYAAYNVAGGAGFGDFAGSVAHHLGMLATTLERRDDAARHFEQAISFESRMSAPPFVACSQIKYAEMLIRGGGADDLRQARRLASEALVTSTRLGMQPWTERAKAVLKGLDAKHIAEHPLSRRELEIAFLVADGLTNRAISEKLHLSERTAESHVKNICDKLGFNSRTQVAAWVSATRPSR